MNWRHVMFEKQGFLDGVCLPEIFTSEPNLCLNVYNGNLEDITIETKTCRIKFIFIKLFL